MDVLGHSPAIGVTMNTYAHVVMQVRKDAAGRRRGWASDAVSGSRFGSIAACGVAVATR